MTFFWLEIVAISSNLPTMGLDVRNLSSGFMTKQGPAIIETSQNIENSHVVSWTNAFYS